MSSSVEKVLRLSQGEEVALAWSDAARAAAARARGGKGGGKTAASTEHPHSGSLTHEQLSQHFKEHHAGKVSSADLSSMNHKFALHWHDEEHGHAPYAASLGHTHAAAKSMSALADAKYGKGFDKAAEKSLLKSGKISKLEFISRKLDTMKKGRRKSA